MVDTGYKNSSFLMPAYRQANECEETKKKKTEKNGKYVPIV